MASDAECLGNLKRLRENINWGVEEERVHFQCQLYYVFRYWRGQLPDLREILGVEEIDWLLEKSVIGTWGVVAKAGLNFHKRAFIIEFVARTGYKDEPQLDENGEPTLRRTTLVHLAARCNYLDCRSLIHKLFKIYDRYDLNYIDEAGMTHLHVACDFGLAHVVEKFLAFRQDLNSLVSATGDTPLHLALTKNCHFVAGLLLRSEANPNLANQAGLTPLHIICKIYHHDDKLIKTFLEICDEKSQQVQVNVEDNLGRTPLQWAVANLLLDMVDILLDRGADLSSFAFPTEDYFAERFKSRNRMALNFNLRLACGALMVVERLEKRGYELELSEALVVMKLFAEYGLFERSTDVKKTWFDGEEFASKAKEIMIKPRLSLHALFRLPFKEAEKQLTYADYFWFASSRTLSCKFGLYEVVQKFLEAGQDPNCLVQVTADTPLHWALASRHESVTELLLRSGANSSVANAEGLTPLHMICKSYNDDKLAKTLFEISDELNQLVLVDAQDRWGRTPLQWAVANLQPKTVDILLDRGADLKSFVFPTVSNFAERFKSRGKISFNFSLKLCVSPSVRLAETKTGVLAVVERLEKRGYELDRSDAMTIMKFFADFGLFEKSRGVEKCWRNDEEFASKSEELMICSDLSLDDFLRLPPKKAEKRLTNADYFEFTRRIELWELPARPREACLVHLSETMSRGFFRRWVLDALLKLTRDKLPIVCCELIIDKLMNEDLCPRTGYKDEPRLDENGEPILRRTTPVHLAVNVYWVFINWNLAVDELFKIYDKFDVNYIDEAGMTHLHVACDFGLAHVVEKFLVFGHDINRLVPATGDTPLHMALTKNRHYVAGLLLRNGADINSVNHAGLTALHISCMNCHSHNLVQKFFDICDEKLQTVRVDAVDNLGRTPLQWAVANLLPNMVDILLDRGADLSSFVFPTEDYFAERFKSRNRMALNFKLRLASGALIIVERLEKRGYELELSEALIVMKLFTEYELFERSTDVEKSWFDGEEFASKAKEIMIKPRLSLHALFRLPLKEAEKQLTYADYFRFARLDKLCIFPDAQRKACCVHLGEIMSRRFFHFWALECFSKLTQHRLMFNCSVDGLLELYRRSLETARLAEAWQVPRLMEDDDDDDDDEIVTMEALGDDNERQNLLSERANAQRPGGMARDPRTGEIYIACPGNGQIVILDRRYRLLRRIRNPDLVTSPQSLAVHEHEIYVSGNDIKFKKKIDSIDGIRNCHSDTRFDFFFSITDKCQHSILVLDRRGQLLRRLGTGRGSSPGQLRCPRGIALSSSFSSSSSSSSSGDPLLLYVADTGNDRVQIYDSRDGSLRHCQTNVDFDRPTDVAVSRDTGHVCVADSGNHKIHVFEPRLGKLIFSCGAYGALDGLFRSPMCVEFGDEDDEIYVGDRDNGRIQVFSAQGQFVRVVQQTTHGFGWISGLIRLPGRGLLVADSRDNALYSLRSS
ncbi:unnamed protein product [Trichogramma brassicae]|uniref:Uncharacterized protein n=1 Tax=Trichogramma brassicae TaxID=86971 RepID=A0A6H5J5L2_9HYME|nr:unnamed protein product [Trichogramma brassicae]